MKYHYLNFFKQTRLFGKKHEVTLDIVQCHKDYNYAFFFAELQTKLLFEQISFDIT